LCAAEVTEEVIACWLCDRLAGEEYICADMLDAVVGQRGAVLLPPGDCIGDKRFIGDGLTDTPGPFLNLSMTGVGGV